MTSDLATKPCVCGETQVEIIGFVETPDKSQMTALRKGWYCVSCRHWEDAILRERAVEDF